MEGGREEDDFEMLINSRGVAVVINCPVDSVQQLPHSCNDGCEDHELVDGS